MEGVLYTIIKCQQQMGIFLIYIFDTNEEIQRMGILKNNMSTKMDVFLFDVVGFF
jgi:hypothetical protein